MNLSYSDIVLIPQYSKVISRSDIITDVKLGNKTFKLPFVPANMKCVIDWQKAGELSRNGYFYIMHRFDDYSMTLKTITHLNTIKDALISISVGIKDKDYTLIDAIKANKLRVDYITVDVAHGHSEGVKNMIQFIKKELPSVFVIAGNIITVDAAKDLAEWGADAIKVGIGGGFACFLSGQKVNTLNGYKNIEDVQIGDEVKTHTGQYKVVYDKQVNNSDDYVIYDIDGIKCTHNHKFYVIHKNNYEKIKSDEDIKNYAEWVKAENLNEDYFLIQN